MQDIVKAQPEAAEPYAAAITTAAVTVFPAIANDVQLMEALSALLATLARAPRCLPHMASAGLPVLLATVQAGGTAQARDPQAQLPTHSSILLEGTLDLIASFATDSDAGAPPRVAVPTLAHSQSLPPLAGIWIMADSGHGVHPCSACMWLPTGTPPTLARALPRCDTERETGDAPVSTMQQLLLKEGARCTWRPGAHIELV